MFFLTLKTPFNFLCTFSLQTNWICQVRETCRVFLIKHRQTAEFLLQSQVLHRQSQKLGV